MLREEEALKFVKKIQKQKIERTQKLAEKHIKEITDWNEEFDSRKDYLYKAKERVHLERKNMSELNKEFIKFQKFNRIFSLPPIKQKIKSKEKSSFAKENNSININQSLQDTELKLKIHYGSSNPRSITHRDHLIEEIKAKYFSEVNNN